MWRENCIIFSSIFHLKPSKLLPHIYVSCSYLLQHRSANIKIVLTSMRARCRRVSQLAAFLQTTSHRLLSASSLSLSWSARSVSSVWSARCVPTMFNDLMILLWLSKSSRNSRWSWITSSSCSMLVGGACWIFCFPSLTWSHCSSRQRSLSSCAQLRFVQSGHRSLPASLNSRKTLIITHSSGNKSKKSSQFKLIRTKDFLMAHHSIRQTCDPLSFPPNSAFKGNFLGQKSIILNNFPKETSCPN